MPRSFQVRKARQHPPNPYSRPEVPGSLDGFEGLDVVDLRGMKELRKKIQQHKLGDLMGQLSSIDIGSSADTCSATWKNVRPG
ncbi:hypothetical protein Pmar_PMAR011474 [Perkinsus marinus ATCC 50983]|uniref:Uncharacterized protein n=1 Tax=Perkinsus marinus (strain ATCC 50983 / TXsc) TaxID=423536 RepID=C5LBX0_PERM5|nr:hypothetical protein Pmar_PMAR011474 [Perkinsus marinus ATCC 50983]EER05453.1 hypothetical protein Pmar_PMAR011474 [Perkinsus marinus ATCC 50983]|eukprot:XP_002773637.1 hypothetical protein Pmar_PMAR011474 [Perkinsus marinus ATCC 50983]